MMPRGRPKKVVETKTEEATVETQSQGRPDPSNRAKRPRRSSASAQGVGPMTLVGGLDEENYVHRVVNDEGNRIDLLKSYGYEVVQDDSVDFVSGNAVKTGSAKSVVVDKRTGKKGVLMRQPREFHEEDKQKKAELIDKREESMFRKLKTEEGRYGDVENTNSLARKVDD
jgi:hypothetical protein